jgi:hypothetical protein
MAAATRRRMVSPRGEMVRWRSVGFAGIANDQERDRTFLASNMPERGNGCH